MFLFFCAYAYAYVACVMLIAQVGTRLNGVWLQIFLNVLWALIVERFVNQK